MNTMLNRGLLFLLLFIATALEAAENTSPSLLVDAPESAPLAQESHQAIPGQWSQWLGNSKALNFEASPLSYQDSSGHRLDTGTHTWRQGRPSLFRYTLDTSEGSGWGDLLNGENLLGRPGTDIYLAFLFESLGGQDRLGSLSLSAKRFPDDAGGKRITLQRASTGELQLLVQPSGQYYPFVYSLGTPADAPELFVLRLHFGRADEPDSLSVWRNPDLDTRNPPTPLLVVDDFPSSRPEHENPSAAGGRHSLAFNIIEKYSGPIRMRDAKSGGTLVTGALRIGTTWQSVLPLSGQ